MDFSSNNASEGFSFSSQTVSQALQFEQKKTFSGVSEIILSGVP
jgi:hypothetical protein